MKDEDSVVLKKHSTSSDDLGKKSDSRETTPTEGKKSTLSEERETNPTEDREETQSPQTAVSPSTGKSLNLLSSSNRQCFKLVGLSYDKSHNLVTVTVQFRN